MRTLTTSTSPQFYWALDRRSRYRAQFNRQFLWQNNSGSKCWNGVMRQKNWNHCNYTWEIIIAGFILLISIDCFSFFLSLFRFMCVSVLAIQLQIVDEANNCKWFFVWMDCFGVYVKTLELTTKSTHLHTHETLKAIIISHFRREKNVFGGRNKKY